MQHHIVLKVAAKLILPFILLFALYVQFHGDFGPGGGFQAGVIFGAGIILYALVFGVGHARAVVAPEVVRVVAALGVLLYAGSASRRCCSARTSSTTASSRPIRWPASISASCSSSSGWDSP